MQPSDLAAIAGLDRQAFGGDRSFFLQRRIELYPDLCKVLEAGGRIAGYIMGRHGRSGVSVGPWVAAPGVANPAALLQSLALETEEAALRIGVLDLNRQSQAMLESLGFERSPQSPWRMALGEPQLPGEPELALAIGSPAKG
jgi:hypothetical protein